MRQSSRKQNAFQGSTDRLVLVENNNHIDYIVLSHSLGQLTEAEKYRFCTYSGNIDRRRRGFHLAHLPQTFQDAVVVTRQLGKRYLWIDSLCLIQRLRRDMKEGLKTMDRVFASAYCTIAASSSTSSKDGFLSRGMLLTITKSHPDVPANFEEDVTQGPLNQRAWVLQERVLSRRTIHSSSNRVYFECGEFVRSDNFAKFISAPGRDYFIHDPHFPQRLELGRHFPGYRLCPVALHSILPTCNHGPT
ncbi:heterokaryon incompatibility protein-domain-containing protein [Schizothecium vesticola]|uniref:Heterokaryon incompatibility protein-domain-containing protein n=1 Tax=Schizothecium vesticola TaxID=314040 RepID=A0AA40K9S4_9PEZI|nr:heterokaryon incompatibility protein-domain-containing protein [Schizothecium vesticola]